VVASRINEETTAEIPFGICVFEGADQENGALLPTAATDLPVGVTYHSHAYNLPHELGDDGLKPGVMLDVAEKGVLWVLTEEAVTPDDPVRVRCVAAGAEQAGAFRTTADDTDDCVDVSAFCRFRSSAGAGELVKLEFDFSNRALADADS
jgi:hypothetical protein